MVINFTPVHYIAIPLLAAFLIPLIAKVSKNSVKFVPGIVLLYLSYVSFTLFPIAINNPKITKL